MNIFEFKLPEIGENIASGTVTGVMVAVGDRVRKGQDLVELETEKASLPVPSPCDGVIKAILFKVGDEVKVGSVIFKIEASAASAGPAEFPDKPAVIAQPAPKPQTISSSQAATAQQTFSTAQPAAAQETHTIKHQNVVVIGAGPGGYAAAFRAADLGQKVTLVDPDMNPGGVCLFRGCIPSKALLHAAQIVSEAREAVKIGIELGHPKINLDQLRAWKDSVVKQLTGGLGQLSRQRKVTYLQGRAVFLDSNTLEIERTGSPKERFAFDKAILATGSRPITLPFAPKSERILDSTSALNIDSIPRTMLLIGGGYIGLELGTVYAELGSQVDVVEMLPQLITGADRDVTAILEKRLKTIFNEIAVETKVAAMKEVDGGIKITFQDKTGATRDKVYEKVLVAIGRRPNTENLGLEKTRVTLTDKGFIQVNAQRLTTDPSIYAIGDITGNPMLAHKASHEGITAAEAISGKKTAFEPNAIPAVVFTDPEIAWCGLTETQALADNRDIKVAKFPWGASGRALTLSRTDGLTKLIIDPQTERILGMTVVGPGAGELIAEGVLAIEMGAVAADLAMSIHPHPTLSETVMESAESFFGHATHIFKPKK